MTGVCLGDGQMEAYLKDTGMRSLVSGVFVDGLGRALEPRLGRGCGGSRPNELASEQCHLAMPINFHVLGRNQS